MDQAHIHPLRKVKFVCKACNQSVVANFIDHELYAKTCLVTKDGFHDYYINSFWLNPIGSFFRKALKLLGFSIGSIDEIFVIKGKFESSRKESFSYYSLSDEERLKIVEKSELDAKLKAIELLLSTNDLIGALEYFGSMDKGSEQYRLALPLIFEGIINFLKFNSLSSMELLQFLKEKHLFTLDELNTIVEASKE